MQISFDKLFIISLFILIIYSFDKIFIIWYWKDASSIKHKF